MENQIVIRTPVVYDCDGKIGPGDQWYIIFSYRNPRSGKMERFRKSKGINKYHTLKARQSAAEKMKQYWTDKLKSGWTPFNDKSVIYDDNLDYQTAIKNYRKLKSTNGTFRFFASKYLDFIKNKVSDTTISTYRSKMRIFAAWMDGRGLGEADISAITQSLMCEFMEHIIDTVKLSKVSVDNYRILLEAVFNHVRKEKDRKQFPNPCFDLPGTKRVNDMAAYPIQEFDISLFKDVIKKRDPQLWLAILFEYYCFLRPRKEVRFLRVGDIDFGRSLLRVREVKAKEKGRIVTIPDPFMKIIRQEYLLQDYDRYLFIFGKGGEPGMQHLSINNLSSRFLKIRRDMGMPEEYKMYSWKHTGNVRADAAKIPIRALQGQNGHVHSQTTEVYMRNKRGEVNEFIKNDFPEI